MLKRIKKSGGFSLIELLAVLAILSILMAVAVPATAGYIKSARRAAAYTESQIAADAVQLYLYDEKEAGRLTVGKLHKLMNLNLSDPENVLADYISGGQKNSRIVSVRLPSSLSVAVTPSNTANLSPSVNTRSDALITGTSLCKTS